MKHQDTVIHQAESTPIPQLGISCPFCNVEWTAEMEVEFDQLSKGCVLAVMAGGPRSAPRYVVQTASGWCMSRRFVALLVQSQVG